MTNTKTTKRALIASALSVLMCISMLIGSTFAWFTDSATTNVNTIQAGTLDVELVDKDGNSLDGQPLKFQKAEGHENEDILWEPGCTYSLEPVKVVNKGNLALKYKIMITGINGSAKLNEVIDWTIKMGETEVEIGKTEFALAAGATSDALTIVGKMQDTAGNDYQGLTIENISITVVATQDDVEADSYGTTYDQNADGTPDHPEYVYVGNNSALKDAMEAADANTVIVLGNGEYTFENDIDTKGSFEVAEGANVTLNMGGNAITTEASKSSDEVKVNEPTIVNKGNLTIENGTIENKNATAGNTDVAAVKNESGTLTLKDCTLTNVSPTSGGSYAVAVTGGVVVLENCNVEGNRGAISVTGGELKMVGGSATATVYYPVYLVGEAKAEFEGVTFVKNNSSKGKALIYNALTTGSATFTDCTFESKIVAETKLEINNTLTGLTFTDCTYTNVKAPTA